MNERIRQLAEQVGGTKKYVPPVQQLFDDELELFAKLIIKECMDVVVKAHHGKINPKFVVEPLEEHFEIERSQLF